MEPRSSIQLIVFGERNRTDIGGVLNEASRDGFRAIETGNLFSAFWEWGTRSLLDQNRLQVSGAHFGYREYEDEVVAEQDRTELPHLESVTISRDYLRRELGV